MSGNGQGSAEFKNTIDQIVPQAGGAKGDVAVSAKFKAHLQLNEFSKTSWNRFDTDEQETLYEDICKKSEIASFAIMMHCANDINTPKRVLLSDYDTQLRQDRIKIAGISLDRDDIDAEGGTRTDMPLRLQTDADVADMGQIIVQPHPEADPENRFDVRKWMAPRLAAIRRAVEGGAEIISLSEFDFPVELGDEAARKEADKEVSEEIQKILDGAGRQIFLIAGSRHQPTSDDEKKAWGNIAKIFASRELKTHRRGRMQANVLHVDHPKLVSANSAGEKITTPRDTNITYYETSLGIIGVLICVDAYSPNILFSLINSRRADETMANPAGDSMRKRLDYIIVPAYNRSRKLYYACQVLSLMCETTVVLVDGWRREKKKPAQTALFVCGRLFSDIRQSDEDVGTLVQDPNNPNFRIWDLSLTYVRDHRQRRFRGTPTLNEAEKQKAFLPSETDLIKQS